MCSKQNTRKIKTKKRKYIWKNQHRRLFPEVAQNVQNPHSWMRNISGISVNCQHKNILNWLICSETRTCWTMNLLNCAFGAQFSTKCTAICHVLGSDQFPSKLVGFLFYCTQQWIQDKRRICNWRKLKGQEKEKETSFIFRVCSFLHWVILCWMTMCGTPVAAITNVKHFGWFNITDCES